VTTPAFTYAGSPARIVFGEGTLARVGDEVARLGGTRPIVLATAQQRAAGEALCAQIAGAGLFAEAAMHTPVEVTDRALGYVRERGGDCLVALGGGSTIGLGKAIAYRTDLAQLAVPTTYAGSEATSVLGQSEAGRKTTLRDPKVLPETIVYDVLLTLTLPRALSVTSALNAIAHAVEGLYAHDGNPVTSALAEQGIAALARALPTIAQRHDDRDARSDALFGAWACGTVLGSVAMGLHHKLCHVLGGSFGLPHAETHAVMLPHVVAFNAAAAPDAMARIARALGMPDPATGLANLARQLGAPTQLRALGLAQDAIDHAAELVVASPYRNPREFDRAAIRELLISAY